MSKFDFETYVIDKLDQISDRLNCTCNDLTEVKTTQKNFIDSHEKEANKKMARNERKFDKRLALFGVAIALFEIWQYFSNSSV